MKYFLIILFLLFTNSSFASSNNVDENEMILDQKIETILNESNLTFAEKTIVQNLAFKRLEEKKNQYNNKSNKIDDFVLSSKENLKKYSAYTSALAVKLVDVASKAGITVDQFIKESFLGKIALFYIFYTQGGEFVFNVFCYILIAFSVNYILIILTNYLTFQTLKPDSSFYVTYNSKRGFLGRLFFKTPTKQKTILFKPNIYNKEELVSGVTGVFFFNCIISLLLYLVICYFII